MSSPHGFLLRSTKNHTMEKSYQRLLNNNKKWVKDKLNFDAEYFARQARSQSPEYLWIGCSDSRIPANEVTNTEIGEIFVHRNIANLVVQTDMNLMSVLQYAVESLKVKHIIVCGHYGCGGVLAAMNRQSTGIVNNWVQNIKSVIEKHADELDKYEDEGGKANRLVELTVMEQVMNLAKTAIVQNAWETRDLHLHGWVYNMHSGYLHNLQLDVRGLEDVDPIYWVKGDQRVLQRKVS